MAIRVCNRFFRNKPAATILASEIDPKLPLMTSDWPATPEVQIVPAKPRRSLKRAKVKDSQVSVG